MKKFAFLSILTALLVFPQPSFCEDDMDVFGFDELLREINPIKEENVEAEPVQPENIAAEDTNTETAENAAIENENTAPEESSAEPLDNSATSENEDEVEKMLNEESPDNTDAVKQDSQPENPENTAATEQPDIVTEIVNNAETDQKARDDARKLLSQKPLKLDLRDSQKRMFKEGEKKRRLWHEKNASAKEETPSEAPAETPSTEPAVSAQETASVADNNQPQTADKVPFKSAPFGLYWGISKAELEQQGFDFKPLNRENYTNVYQVLNAKQDKKTFELIAAVFGEQDRLWCIFAQSAPMEDTPNAAKILALYNKYYTALKQKYGNDQEFFTPNIYVQEVPAQEEGTTAENEDSEESDNANRKMIKQTVTSPLGGENFLKELQEETASLYATFESDEIGVTLGISADNNAKTFLSLDYKNLQEMKKEQDDTFNNLLNDL